MRQTSEVTYLSSFHCCLAQGRHMEGSGLKAYGQDTVPGCGVADLWKLQSLASAAYGPGVSETSIQVTTEEGRVRGIII